MRFSYLRVRARLGRAAVVAETADMPRHRLRSTPDRQRVGDEVAAQRPLSVVGRVPGEAGAALHRVALGRAGRGVVSRADHQKVRLPQRRACDKPPFPVNVFYVCPEPVLVKRSSLV
eukprot:COSAG06_NODE_15604_length_1058_cov_25.662921_2_plen_117_part_00